MRVYVDESGDAGMKLGAGSSPFFVVAAVLFAGEDDAAKCADGIQAVRKKLNHVDSFEFKFNKLDQRRRTEFLNGVRTYEFRYMAIALNKAKAWGPGFKYKESLHKYTARLLFLKLKPFLHEATVVLDGCGDRDFRTTMRSYLKKHTTGRDGVCPIRHVTDRDSRKDDLIQLADMVAGAIGRSLREDCEDRHTYRSIIKSRELWFGIWP